MFFVIDLKFAVSSVIFTNSSLVMLNFNKLLNNYKLIDLNFFHSFNSLILYMIIGFMYCLSNS